MNFLNFFERTVTLALIGTLVLGCQPTANNSAVPEHKVDDVKAIIWEKELAIFSGRGAGDISFYLNSASEDYLGWPPVLPEPATLDVLKASQNQSIALRGEVSNLTQKGFTMSGNTALMYFVNHRTRLGEGFAAEDQREVDEYYENVHVWNFLDDEWQLIGGFARRIDRD